MSIEFTAADGDRADEVVEVDLARGQVSSVGFDDLAGPRDVAVSDEPLEELGLEPNQKFGVVAANHLDAVRVDLALVGGPFQFKTHIFFLV